jgi:sec-independent protein translocase protein TatC
MSAETDQRQPFLEHLRELRIRLRNAVLALIIACAICFTWAEGIFGLLVRPLFVAWERAKLGPMNMVFGSLTEPFWVYFEVSMYAGVFIASPFIFHQLWKFIAPGLYAKEKRIAIPFAVFSGLFFIGGGLFCYYFVLPAMFKFLLSYSQANLGHIKDSFGLVDIKITDSAVPITPTLFMQNYLDLATRMLLAFGLVFEMPLLIFFLSYAGVVTPGALWRFNKYWIVISVVVGGILTPGPDIVSQLMMAAPLIVLYNLSILVAFLQQRNKPPTDVLPVD